MRSLKQRRVSFTRPAEPRTRRLMVIRWVYLGSIVFLAVWLANFFFGDMLYLRSEGLVVGQPSVVAAEFPVTVRDLLVREGEHVKAGQVAAVVTSQEVLETIARLSADIAARQVRLGQLRIRDQTTDAMLALAENSRQCGDRHPQGIRKVGAARLSIARQAHCGAGKRVSQPPGS